MFYSCMIALRYIAVLKYALDFLVHCKRTASVAWQLRQFHPDGCISRLGLLQVVSLVIHLQLNLDFAKHHMLYMHIYTFLDRPPMSFGCSADGFGQ